MLGRIIKIFISSILQRRPRIFKDFFFCLVEQKDIRLLKSAKKSQYILEVFYHWYNDKDIYFFSTLL